MHRPFEAVGAVLFGLLIYCVITAGYYVVTGAPVNWILVVLGVVGFVLGALVARNLWK